MYFVYYLLTLILGGYAYAQDVPEWKQIPIRQDLYQYREQEISQGLNFDELNKKIFDSLENYRPEENPYRSPGIDYEQGQKIMKALLQEDFYKNAQTQYDVERNLGLCFGRAIYLHLMLLKYGVNKDSIKKIFVIGPMDSGSGAIVWQFHVATIVKDSQSNKWWALDTNFDKPILVEDWMYQMKRKSLDKTFRLFREPLVDKTKSLRFYVTDAQKIGPSGWEYNIKPGGLFDSFYNNYFKDMFKSLSSRIIPRDEKFNKLLAPRCNMLLNNL